MSPSPEPVSVSAGSEEKPTKKGKLRITLELDVRRMTRAEAGETGPVPFLDEYTPAEIADLVAYGIDGEDAQAEMFAGSMIFVKINKVAVRSAAWIAAATASGEGG